VSARRLPLVLLTAFLVALLWSAVRPWNYAIWALEVFPALLACVVLVATYRRFPLTRLLYTLIFLHALILVVGGHYSYARVPAGDWLRDAFTLSRNHFDRLGHFAQGFVPAMVAREILLRRRVVRGRWWLFFLVTCVALAISAAYELLEWGVAVWSESSAEDFLATQGDPWDTQKDMALAAVGAVLAQLALGRWHDRQLRDCQPARDD
jgi:putative membrane protein